MPVHILHLSDLHARPERHADMEIVVSALFTRLEEICTSRGSTFDCTECRWLVSCVG